MEIKDKKIIVTGGASGIGKNLVDALIPLGAFVGIFDINTSGFDGYRDYENVMCIECDITDYNAVERSVDRFFERFGQIDILVNNAGILHSEPLVGISGGIQKHSKTTWDKVISTNLTSVFNLSVLVVEKMIIQRVKGLIINVSSISASGNAGQSAYSAAKAGINALTSVWAKELSPLGIRVVGIAPGFTNTDSTNKIMSEKALQDVIKKVPLRRLGDPSEIVEGLMFLISNDFYNGKTLEIDGGLII